MNGARSKRWDKQSGHTKTTAVNCRRSFVELGDVRDLNGILENVDLFHHPPFTQDACSQEPCCPGQAQLLLYATLEGSSNLNFRIY
jgi:hypothetical protein